MKKIVSSILIFSTLFSCAPISFGVDGIVLNKQMSTTTLANDEKIKKISLREKQIEKDAEQNSKIGLSKIEALLNEQITMVKCSSSIDKDELKVLLLELSKDKKFTDILVKNYTKSHEDPIWLKIIKLPFKTVWYLIKRAFEYTVGKKVTKFIKKVVIPAVATYLTGCLAYKNIPVVKKIVDWIFNKNKTESKNNKNDDNNSNDNNPNNE